MSLENNLTEIENNSKLTISIKINSKDGYYFIEDNTTNIEYQSHKYLFSKKKNFFYK